MRLLVTLRIISKALTDTERAKKVIKIASFSEKRKLIAKANLNMNSIMTGCWLLEVQGMNLTGTKMSMNCVWTQVRAKSKIKEELLRARSYGFISA